MQYVQSFRNNTSIGLDRRTERQTDRNAVWISPRHTDTR